MHEAVLEGEKLLEWYGRERRDLPWRRRTDPYGVWLAEAMLQQTRVETVIPYYVRFLHAFPTLEALAAAPLDEVLGCWAGLGYYRRARQLHAAAQEIVRAGRFPTSAAELGRLPGFGPYTAAAVASIAFGEDILAVDGNIERVICRFRAITLPPSTGAGRRLILEHGMAMLSQGRAGDFNQALMDLGATLCTPRAARCEPCPWTGNCLARRQGMVEHLPLRPPSRERRVVRAVSMLCRRGDALLMVRQPAKGLLADLWDLPSMAREEREPAPEALLRCARERLGVDARPIARLGAVRHAFTHLDWHTEIYAVELLGEPLASYYPERRFVDAVELSALPLSSLARRSVATAISQPEPEIDGER